MNPLPLNESKTEPAGFTQRVAQTKATLEHIANKFSPAVLASSLAAEDMVLTDLILRNKLNIGIFSLETGRLPAETSNVIEQVSKTYQYQTVLFYPNSADVVNYVNNHGLNAFYDSVELRKECCRIRKVEPLKRALAGNKAWITGQRRSQSSTRTDLPLHEPDELHGLAKFNPLAEWSLEDVWFYIHQNHVPYNALHDRGYPSIGCEPCTRAIKPGEDIRAGRWWWESADNKECGLHTVSNKTNS